VSKRTAIVAAVLAALLVPLLAAPASAHGHRDVGDYSFVVGFGVEPAYAGAPNSVQLILSDHHSGKPVTDLKDTLKVAVSTGDAEAKEMALAPYFEVGEWGEPGDYRAFFIPTAPGAYTFHFTGTIKGEKIDESFTSKKDGFDEMTDPAEVQYPEPQPSGSELSTRLERETTRINSALAAERDQAQDDAASARTLATVGLVVGTLGLLAAIAVGVFALRRKTT
jgi:hypothetical protein